jgi:hypothetical protein
MSRPGSIFVLAAGLSLLLGACGGQTTTRVPRIVGLNVRSAEVRLFREHLRWRVAPGTKVFSRPLPSGQYSSNDEFPVTGQRPAAGTAAKTQSVITILTPCTSTAPCS